MKEKLSEVRVTDLGKSVLVCGRRVRILTFGKL